MRAQFWMIHRYVRNLPPMPGVFPDYPATVVCKKAIAILANRMALNTLGSLLMSVDLSIDDRTSIDESAAIS